MVDFEVVALEALTGYKVLGETAVIAASIDGGHDCIHQVILLVLSINVLQEEIEIVKKCKTRSKRNVPPMIHTFGLPVEKS